MTDKPYIQLIDDRPDDLQVLEKILSTQDHRVQTFIEGEPALASAFELPPDLILLATQMPEMDGYELCQRLKADERTRNIPVLFLTTPNSAADKADAFAVGGADYLTQPFQAAEVLARVATHLALSRAIKQLDWQNDQFHSLNQALNRESARRKQSEADLASEHSLLNAILESSNSPIFSLDRDLRYTSFNQAHAAVMKALYGVNIEVNKKILAYQTNAQDRATARRNLERALQGEVVIESAYSGEEGSSRRYFEVVHNPIRDEAGQVTGISVFAIDITDRKRAEDALEKNRQQLEALVEERTIALQAEVEQHRQALAALQTSEERLKLAQNIAKIGHWSWEVVSDRAEWSDQVYRIFQAPRQKPSYKFAKSFVHPADLELWEDAVQQAIQTQEPFALDYRAIRSDGETIWVHNETKAVHDERGEFVGYQGTVQDITARKQAEEALQARTQELAAALGKVKQLSGLLPICTHCKKIRNDEGYWQQVEVYIRDHSEAVFSHGLCPDCARTLYPDFWEDETE